MVALAITLAIATAPYWEVLAGRRTAMYGDVNDFYVPGYVAVWRNIRAGHLPWWTQNVFAGHSMLGTGQYGVFYPFNAVYGWLDPATAYRWWMLAHVWLAAAAAFTWSWRRWGSRPGAIVSGFSYALSGFVVLHLVHPAFLVAAAWLPLVFVGIDLVLERWTWNRAAIVALPLAFIAVGGQPQLLWISFAGALIYLAALALTRACRLAGAGRAVGALAVGLGIGAVQTIPAYLFSRTSLRPAVSMKAAFENSVTPHHLLLFGFPYLYGGSSHGPSFDAAWSGGGLQQEVGNYLGITILALAVIGIALLPRDRLLRALAVTAVVAVLIGMGRSTPAGSLVYRFVLGARSFRDWGRVMLVTNLGIAMLAGAGVRELLRAPRRVIAWIVAAAGVLAVVVLTLPHLGVLQKQLATGSAGTIARWSPIVLLVGLAAAAAIVVVNRRAGAGALILVCAVDMVLFAYVAPWHAASMTPTEAHAFYSAAAPAFGRPANEPGGLDRWASDSYVFRSISLVKNMLGVNGYDPLMQKDWAETAGGWISDGYPTRADLWQPGWTADVLRVSTLVLSKGVVPSDRSWKPVYSYSASPNRFTRWVRAPRLADAYLVGAVHLMSLAEIRSQLVDPYANLRAAAYIERRTPGTAGLDQPGAAGTVISEDLLGSGKVTVDASRAALLVLSQDWERGWHATVDGRPAPVLRTDGLVIGVAVPRGRHVVRISFTPPGLGLGALVAFLALLVLLLAAPLVSLARRVRVARWFTRASPG